MKIISAILIALIFTLVWLLKFEWYINMWIVNLIGYDDTFDADLGGFFVTITNYIYYFPELIYNSEKESIKNILLGNYSLDDKDVYLWIIFIFFWIFTSIIIYILKFFYKKSDKIYLVLWIIISYLLIAEFMM